LSERRARAAGELSRDDSPYVVALKGGRGPRMARSPGTQEVIPMLEASKAS
jgi:hypothetical protein